MAILIKGNDFPIVARKIQPNSPCRCGSGKKAKKCCGTETQYYYSKLNDSQKRKIEAEAKAKELLNETAEV